MSPLSHVATEFDDEFSALLGALGAVWIELNGEPFLVTSGRVHNQLAMFRVDGSNLVLLDEIDLGVALDLSNHGGLFEAESLVLGDGVFVLGGSAPSELNFIPISNEGFGNPVQGSTGPSEATAQHMTVLSVDGQEFVVYPGLNGSGLSVAEIQNGGVFSAESTLSDSVSLPLGDVAAIASATIAGASYVFAASAFDGGIAAFMLDGSGELTLTDTVLPGDGSGFYLPQALATVTLGECTFLAMASAGTSSVTLYEVGSDGSLSEIDHVLDDLGTRFQSITLLVGFEVEGRAFFAVAGSDDGFSILEVGANGTLSVVATIADSFDFALQNISGLDVTVENGVAILAATSDADHGVSVFDFIPPEEELPEAEICVGFPFPVDWVPPDDGSGGFGAPDVFVF